MTRRVARPLTKDDVTIERLERALETMALIVMRHGEEYLPFFERLERELAALKSRETALDRVRARLKVAA